MKFILIVLLIMISGFGYSLDDLRDIRSPVPVEPEVVVRSDDQIVHKLGERSKALEAILIRSSRKGIDVKGYVEIELTITPLGRVSKAKKVSATINHDAVIQKLLSRTKLIGFGKDLNSKVWVGCFTYMNESEFKIFFGCKE